MGEIVQTDLLFSAAELFKNATVTDSDGTVTTIGTPSVDDDSESIITSPAELTEIDDESIFTSAAQSSGTSLTNVSDAEENWGKRFVLDKTKSPDENAQAYADAFDVEFEEAQAILSSVFGDPQTGEGAFSFDELKSPDENAQAYADIYDMDIDSAKEILSSVLGDMQRKDENNMRPAAEGNNLIGVVPDSVLAKKDDDLIKEYLEEQGLNPDDLRSGEMGNED